MQAKIAISFPKQPVRSDNQANNFTLTLRRRIMEVKMQIARSVRRARESRNLKQEYVAEELGISSSSYSKIERGVNSLKVELAIPLADLLGISVDELVGKVSERAIMASEAQVENGRSIPEQVVFVFNGAGKNSPKADKFLRKLTEVMRDLDDSDYADFLDQ